MLQIALSTADRAFDVVAARTSADGSTRSVKRIRSAGGWRQRLLFASTRPFAVLLTDLGFAWSTFRGLGYVSIGFCQAGAAPRGFLLNAAQPKRLHKRLPHACLVDGV